MTDRLIPGLGYMTFSRSASALVPGLGYVEDEAGGAVLATALSMTGPASGMTNYPSGEFALTLNGALSANRTVTMSDGGAGGTFNPASFVLTPSVLGFNCTYTPTVAGPKTISASISGSGIANPAPLAYEATPQVFQPTVSISNVTIDGDDVTLTLALGNEPTSGVATMTATSGGVSQGPISVTISGATGSVAFVDLVPGTYSAAVTVSNVMGPGNSAPVDPITIGEISGEIGGGGTTPATAPGAPTNLVATAGVESASVSLTAPASNGGATITSYTVTSSPGNIAATGPASPITVTGLTAGQAYTFTATATNSAGTGSASTASNSVTPTAAAAATAITMSGPTSGYNNNASPVFTIGANGTISGTVIVTPASSAGTGSFSPASVSISSAQPTATFTYTGTSLGSRTISVTNNGSLATPSSIVYMVLSTVSVAARARRRSLRRR